MAINIKVDDNRVLKVGDIVKYISPSSGDYYDCVMIIYDKFNVGMPYRLLDIESGEILNGFLALENMYRHIVRVYEGDHDLIIK